MAASTPQGVSRGDPPSGSNRASSLIGTTLGGRYLIERLLGEGGMGAVYQAEHTHMRKKMAVKVLHPDMTSMAEVVARFEREAMAAAHIEHPNIALATDFGQTDNGSFFLVLEYVEGGSLRDLLAQHAPLSVGRTLHILRQIASALLVAHAKGIVHRDLKPENVMLVERNGDPDFVKVLDFGIAKVPVGKIAAHSSAPNTPGPGIPVLTQMGMVYGTPEYMSPEQAAGMEVDGSADQYALGIMAYEMLLGERPFDAENKVIVMRMHVTADVPPMAEKVPQVRVPAEVEALVMRLLEKEPQKRFADAKELIEVIDGILVRMSSPYASFAARPPSGSLRLGEAGGGALGSGRPSPVNSPGAMPIMASPARQRPRLALIGGAALATGIVVAVVVMSLAGRRPEPSTKTDPVASVPQATESPSAAGVEAPDPAIELGENDEITIEQLIEQANAAFQTKDYGRVIELLTPAAKGSRRSDVHELLFRAYASQGKTSQALDAADRWLRVDASGARNPKLVEVVRGAVLDTNHAQQAIHFLETRMGPAGPDILYDLAYGDLVQRSPYASSRAREALRKKEVYDRASPAVQVTLDLRSATGCEDKKVLLPKAKEAGDARTLVPLRDLTKRTGCGKRLKEDCWPCMRRDIALDQTIAAVERRSRGR